MKNRFFIAIVLVLVVCLSGCELSLANDPVAKAALRDSSNTVVTGGSSPVVTVTTVAPLATTVAATVPVDSTVAAAAPIAEVEVPVTFAPAAEVEVPVTFSPAEIEVPVTFTPDSQW